MLALLGFALVCLLAARRSPAEHRPRRGHSGPLTPAFVRGVVGAAEPLRDGATSVRALRPSDADAVASSIDDVVTRAMGWPVDAAANYAKAVRRRLAPKLMGITEHGHDVVIGVVSLDPLPMTDGETEHRTVRIGMWTGPQARGRGHMGRAVRVLADLMIANDISVVAETATTNHAAQHVLERAGLVETGHRVVRLLDGSDVDAVVYERLAPQPAQRRPDPHP